MMEGIRISLPFLVYFQPRYGVETQPERSQVDEKARVREVGIAADGQMMRHSRLHNQPTPTLRLLER